MKSESLGSGSLWSDGCSLRVELASQVGFGDADFGCDGANTSMRGAASGLRAQPRLEQSGRAGVINRVRLAGGYSW